MQKKKNHTVGWEEEQMGESLCSMQEVLGSSHHIQLGIMMYTYDPSTLEVGAGGSLLATQRVQSQPELHGTLPKKIMLNPINMQLILLLK